MIVSHSSSVDPACSGGIDVLILCSYFFPEAEKKNDNIICSALKYNVDWL